MPPLTEKNSLGFIEITNKPNAKELREFYVSRYYQEPTGQYDKTYSESEILYFRNKARVCAATLNIHSLEPKTLFEIGSGEGFFAEFFYGAGVEVSLNDYSQVGLSRFHPHLLDYFYEGDSLKQIKNFASQMQTFDLISMDNVLEHVLDPIELLQSIKLLMSERTIVRITVPNDYSGFQHSLVRAGKSEETWVNPPEHLSYFNTENLKTTCESLGFHVLSLQVDFPIELFLSNDNSHYYLDRKRGRGAHEARVFCTNYLVDKDILTYIKMSECAAQLEFGRNATIYLTL